MEAPARSSQGLPTTNERSQQDQKPLNTETDQPKTFISIGAQSHNGSFSCNHPFQEFHSSAGYAARVCDRVQSFPRPCYPGPVETVCWSHLQL